MFKNEITTSKKKFFENFRFFFPEKIQKIDYKIRSGPIILMNFFFKPASFLHWILKSYQEKPNLGWNLITITSQRHIMTSEATKWSIL